MNSVTQNLSQIGTAVISDALKALKLENTSTTIYQKSEALKQNKDIKELHTGYMDIINELLQQKQEAILIAEGYKNELERVQISDDDIVHLNATVKALLDTLLPLMPTPTDDGMGANDIEPILNAIISTSTLRTLQLVGFNFKEAIGEPLTKLVCNLIQGNQHIKNINDKANKQQRR